MSVFLPFELDFISENSKTGDWLAYGLGEISNGLNTLETSTPLKQIRLAVVEPWRPYYLSLKEAGLEVSPINKWQGREFSGGLLELTKHKGLNQNNFLALLKHIKPNGLIIISGEKSAGAQSMLKWVNRHFAIQGKLAKNHKVIFWLRVPEKLDADLMLSLNAPVRTFGEVYQTASGMFSHGRVDQGSLVLIENVQQLICGKTADLGAGWGYLSVEILKNNNKCQGLDLYEADFNALEHAKQHLNNQSDKLPIQFFWHDIMGEPIADHYDTIITNPPFHNGRDQDLTLGQRFIAVAALRLKPGGKFLMVANRHLPYENHLKQFFGSFMTLYEDKAFKVFAAKR